MYKERRDIAVDCEMVNNRERCLHSSLYIMPQDGSRVDEGNNIAVTK